jgi:ATP-binding cassette subfamily B protein
LQPSGINWVVASPLLIIGGYAALRILVAVLTQLQTGLFSKVGMHAVRRLSTMTFEQLHCLSLRFHHDRRTGGLSRELEHGYKAIETILEMLIVQLAPTAIEFILILALMLMQFDWRYAVILFITVTGLVAFTVIATEWRIRIRRDMLLSDAAAHSTAVDSLFNYETVKYFTAEQSVVSHYDLLMERYGKAKTRVHTSLALVSTIQTIILTVGIAAMMVLCAYDVLAGNNTVGDFILVNALMLQLSLPLNYLSMAYREIKLGAVDLNGLFSILEATPDVRDRRNASDLVVGEGAIEFRDVSFSYEQNRPILTKINFKIRAGSTVAIVGASGTGKSTISKLLFRLYDACGGTILIDNQDIRGVTQISLRAALSIVPQEVMLFNDSIYHNIRYGRWAATRCEVEKAAKVAELDKLVSTLSDGYNTLVGERGMKLSGGEKQRIAIARAALKNAPILILDEATSAIDFLSERKLQAALGTTVKQRTTLIIAHRLSSVANADEIIVLREGGIIERGTHEHLLAARGYYAAVWNEQSLLFATSAHLSTR